MKLYQLFKLAPVIAAYTTGQIKITITTKAITTGIKLTFAFSFKHSLSGKCSPPHLSISILNLLRYKKENNKLKEKKFQKNSVEKYQKYLQNIQNSMTLYGVEPKKAKLLAKKEIAHYFKKDMKKFLSTQKFIEENDKGVIFELSYTQPKEILPFIKKWIPNLLIIEPKELKEEFMSELKAMLKEYSKDFSETIHNSVSVDMIIS